MNYNALSQKAHSAAVAAGWHDIKRSQKELLCLIVSEMFEAMEAWRNNKVSIINEVQKENLYKLLEVNITEFKKVFKRDVKDSVQDELADVFIRTLDMAGYYKITIPEVYPLQPLDNILDDTWSFTELCFEVSKQDVTRLGIATILGYIVGICNKYGYDLLTHIELKMAYNATRGYKHGNKKA